MVAVFSFRYDAHLVPGLVANIEPFVDGWISYDDRASTEVFSNEVQRRTALLQAACATGADWVLAVDPDERMESGLAPAINELLGAEDSRAYTFRLRELYAPDAYRVDGIWNEKRQARLLSLRHGLAAPQGNLHLSWASFVNEPQLHNTDFNLYHLKMITAERRKARASLYKHLDPEHQAQSFGYDYLADETGAVLEGIAPGREYYPAHEEDGGLWMARLV